MQDIKVLLMILSSLTGIILVLIGYIIKTKDATERATKETLKEVSTLINTMTQNVMVLKLELENNIHSTRNHNDTLSKHNDLIHSIRILGTRLNGRVNALEKDIIEVKKIK